MVRVFSRSRNEERVLTPGGDVEICFGAKLGDAGGGGGSGDVRGGGGDGETDDVDIDAGVFFVFSFSLNTRLSSSTSFTPSLLPVSDALVSMLVAAVTN
jgi:hypothetical protein